MRTDIKIEENSVVPTLVITVISAVVGGIIAIGVGLVGATLTAVGTGPFFLVMLPIIMAGAATAITWVIIGVPLWALLIGYIFARNSSSKMGLAATSMNVIFFHEEHAIYKRVQELAAELDLPRIRHVGWFPEQSINAFAMGLEKTDALLAFSEGAVDQLSKDAFDAVIGHELAHVANGDMRNMTLAHGMQDSLTFFLLFRGLKRFGRWVFSPLAELGILHYSRAREFAADKIGAQLVSPVAMIEALEAIDAESKPTHPIKSDFETFKLSSSFTQGLWRTHPSTARRINKLKIMEQETETSAQSETAEPAAQSAPKPSVTDVSSTITFSPKHVGNSAGVLSFGV